MSESNQSNNKKCQRRIKKPFIWLIIIGLVIGTGTLIISQFPEVGYGKDGHWGRPSPERKAKFLVKMLTHKLDLTEKQQKRVNKIKNEILAKRKEFKGVRQEILNGVLSQIKKPKVNEATLNQLLASKEVHLKTMRKFLVSKFAEFHSILTPAQKVKLAKGIKEFHKRHKR